MAEARLPLFAEVRAVAQDAHRHDDEVVEVDRVHRAERALVAGVDLARDVVVLDALLRGAARGRALAAQQLLGREEVVLPLADAREERRRVELARGARLHVGAQQLAHEAERVALIEDHEAPVGAERLPLFAEQPHTERVERAEHDAARDVGPDERRHALGHLARGLVREAHREDRLGSHAALEQARDALRDHARLAAAGAGEHEQGTNLVLDRGALRLVEAHAAARRSAR